MQASQPVQQAYRQARWAYQKAMMEEESAKSWAELHRCTFRKFVLWGVGAGLLADLLLLIGALVWSKLTAKA